MKTGCHPITVNAALKRYLGWQKKADRHIRVVALTHNKDLHTHIGMLGYCSKDRGKPCFLEICKGVTDEMLAVGQEIHSLEGKADFKQLR